MQGVSDQHHISLIMVVDAISREDNMRGTSNSTEHKTFFFLFFLFFSFFIFLFNFPVLIVYIFKVHRSIQMIMRIYE
ncbi:hypothetical protein BDV25DRAFT_151868 [Aspergillus avenaceus]|uniref:Uncharacterized protein n=1 Tax=Aspergillus avenaceus TaxID=36643 RepID=A0A5N6U095_ASPAV|nr:hypothetical protein BDV25DRAFT_151868 [Aspergillus avenaceus]